MSAELVRAPRAALALLWVVGLMVALQFGGLVARVLADTGGGAPTTTVALDPVSDAVAATAAEFRVDESGAATYSIPLYAVPGTAGVAPKIALSYSSQGAYGPLGKGWSISGLSSVSRCRATREAGDFIVSGVPTDGMPSPVNYTASDRYCLDGQRLVPAQGTSAGCPAVSGMTAQNLRTEIESFQRVCAYTPTGGTDGPAFFTVDRKDGSRSWYGDRDNATTANRADAYFNSTAVGHEAAALSWAQTRFQDSNGNYIDFTYLENPAGAGTGEHLISEIRYTGKLVLPGQTGTASAPYAKLTFNYVARAAAQWGKGYVAGGLLTQSRRLASVTACASAAAGACAAANQARHYQLAYAASPSGSSLDVLTSLRECRDSSLALCLPATAFTWSGGKYEFATKEYPANLPTGSLSKFEGFKVGDVDGDGRQDLVYLKDGSSGETCPTEYVLVLYGIVDGAGHPSFVQSAPICTPAELESGRGEGAWHLLDYNGDGRDDLFVSAATGTGWRVYLSQGRAGNSNFIPTNAIAALSPAIPSQANDDDQVQLADLNGDGLTDIVYPSAGVLKARLMERQGTTFGWGQERTVSVDMASVGTVPGCGPLSGATCTQELAGAPSNKTGFMQMADFNGDSASDILLGEIQTKKVYTGAPGCQPQPQFAPSTRAGHAVLPYRLKAGDRAERRIVSDPCYSTTISRYLHLMVVQSVTATTINIASYAKLASPESINFVDANADGLTDVFYRATSTSEWAYRINTGLGLLGSVTVDLLDFEKEVRFADVNGDGRTDILHLINTGPYKAYNVLYALPAGGYGAETWLPGVTGSNGNALICEGYSCDQTRKVPMFTDLDGDGNLDFMSLKMDDNADLFISRASSRFVPRDVVTRITNGFGSQTNLVYAPLTNAAVYRRGSGSRNATNWGRGAPVQDFLAPTYVVARASSSSPQAGAPTAQATVHYRYAGGRIQAGGRGFLGFDTIETIDPNQTGGYVVTATKYAQNFPFIGMPVRTTKSAVLNQAYAVPACLNGTMNDSCFTTPGNLFPALSANWFSDSAQVWEADTDIGAGEVAYSAGVQAPVHVRTAGTEEKLRDPIGGAQTSRVVTTFAYGAYGNAVGTTVDTYNGSTSLLATVITANVYASDNPTLWRLGRLTSSTVTHRRPGRADVVRKTEFAYAMSGPATGQLVADRSQGGGPADQDLRHEYTYDPYGNRTLTRTCANPATACSTTVAFHPAAPTIIQRYGRTAYDSRGRFPVASYEPFWSGSAAVERSTQTIVARDLFGNVTRAYDVNGRDSIATAGGMGQQYYTWTETVAGSVPGTVGKGVESLTTYRWCGTGTNQVSCPTGAKFRQKVAASGAPTEWTYLDVLGRPVLKLVESFNAGVSGKDASAVCTTYDATGKPKQVSNPFFVAGTIGGEPTGLTDVCTSGRLWTTTHYDVLGRPTDVQAPDASVVSTDYVGSQTILTDPRGNTTTQVRNALGELTKVTDANGLVVTYGYESDGSNYVVSRNAGRGVIQNVFYYDAMGRKIRQVDPDSGTTLFEYNALGEMTAQQDSLGNRIENEIDARGRIWRRTVKPVGGGVESQSVFIFDTAPNGVGQLASEAIAGTYSDWVGQSGVALNASRGYTYDSLGRPLGSTTSIDGVNYPTAVQYDALGRPWKAQDASGRWVKTVFNGRGMAESVCNSSATDVATVCPADANTYLRTLETDAWGHTVKERRGNSAAMDVTRSYWADTGRTRQICAGNATTCSLVNEQYAWDRAGNLSTQQKENRYLEAFTYDSLNRLTQATLTMQDGVTANVVAQRFEYDQLGNVCYRQALGQATIAMTYVGRSGCGLGGANSANGGGGTGTVGAHQVSQAGTGPFYYYDTRGNQTIKDAASATYDRTIRYSLDDRAYEAVSGTGVRTRFWYGSDGQRYKREDGSKRTLYLGNVEIVTEGTVTTIKRTIAGVVLQTVTGTTAVNYYMFHDQLGSLVRITNAAGAVVNNLDFLGFGGRRNFDTQAAGGTAPSLSTRGFTGHEMVDGVLNLIHMNGRIFDPDLGRFLQADPVIQAPENGQSWNAYTYVFNNPYRYTDPTGMIGQTERQWLGAIVAIVGTIFFPYAADWWVKLGYAIALGATVGGITTGTWRGAVIGAFSSAVTFGIANSGWGPWGKVAAQAVSGGVMESLQGGNFGNGFFAAGLTAVLTPSIGAIKNDFRRAITGALVGGTVSEATGGKFANGAVSGAIQAAMAAGQDYDEVPESDRPYLAYANDTYHPSRGDLMTNQELESKGIDPGSLVNEKTGFSASVYHHAGGYVVAFRGSDSLIDWTGTNIPQAFGMANGQYSQAAKVAFDLSSALGNNVVFTGHSLGGGLASVAALRTGLPAVTFNAAGVSSRTLSRLGISSRNEMKLITSYRSASDLLSMSQALTPLPNALGHAVWVAPAGFHGSAPLCLRFGC